MVDKVQISEIFYSVQGEGPFVGYPAIFVRFSKCPVRCKWCDSKFSWRGGDDYSLEELVKCITLKEAGIVKKPIVVLTGGEPAVVDEIFLADLIKCLKELRYFVHVETAGIRWLDCFKSCDFIVLSPKREWYEKKGKEYVEELVKYKIECNDLIWKFVVKDSSDINFIKNFISEMCINEEVVWLMPEGKTREEVIRKLPFVIEQSKKFGYRVSDRLHIIAYNGRKRV